MDDILSKAGSQAVTFAIRSGISIASTYAVKSLSKFLAKVPEADRLRLERTKQRLQTRIEIVSSAIDLIKLVAARGNTNLESTLRLTKDLKQEIDKFDEKIQEVDEAFQSKNEKASVQNVELYMLDLSSRIEEAIPLINLSLTTSGANLSGSLPKQISPGRLLQSSNYVNKSNEEFKGDEIQIGPAFRLTSYSIFYHGGRLVNNSLSEISWKEEFPRADVTIWRLKSPINQYIYELRINENFNDERYHDDDDEPKSMKLDIGLITRLFFSASGKLLKLEERSSPVLLLKINKYFKKLDEYDNNEEAEFKGNPIEWLGFGDYENSSFESSDEEDEREGLNVIENESKNPYALSLLEYILRLCVLQTNDQLSILEVKDERLALYLNDENEKSTDAVGESTFTQDSPTKIIGQNKFSTASSTPVGSNTDSVTRRLRNVRIDDNDHGEPSTPNKQSPIPGDAAENFNFTPWERDKLVRKLNLGAHEETPASEQLRKQVLKNIMTPSHTRLAGTKKSSET